MKKKTMENEKIAVETKTKVTISQKIVAVIMMLAGIATAVSFAAALFLSPKLVIIEEADESTTEVLR